MANTMQFKSFDPSNLKAIRTDLDAALKIIGGKYGITMRSGNGKCSKHAATIKIEAAIPVTVDPAAELAEKAYFADQMKTLFRLTAHTTMNGRVLVDWHQRKHAYPFIYRDTRKNNKLFKCSEADAKLYFGIKQTVGA
jgi:hypothetical protein